MNGQNYLIIIMVDLDKLFLLCSMFQRKQHTILDK